MTLAKAIRHANTLLPGKPRPEGKIDPRWQAIIRIGYYIESHPEEVWNFVARWGVQAQEDLRAAIATCLLEHLLQHHFTAIFPRVKRLARTSKLFADTFCQCCKFGEAERPKNRRLFDDLQDSCCKKFKS